MDDLDAPEVDGGRSGVSRLLASGRTADVFLDAPDRVRRVYRDGRDATAEADLMRHLAAHGFPVPTVHEARGPVLVLERIEGPTLADDALAHPERFADAAATLRTLFDRLAEIPAPAALPQPFGPGEAVLHLDLHPFNVLLGPRGPVVIDWATAARGPAAADRAYAYVVVATAELPDADEGFRRLQQVFADALLDGDDDPARAWVAAAARLRLQDPFVLPAERPRLHALGRLTFR